MNTKQQGVYDSMKKGNSMMITGMAGSGKSYVIEKFYNDFKDKLNIGITSTTGISALLIKGVTLHSFLGIGLGKDTIPTLIQNIKQKRYIKKRWIELHTLIIDEVSMLSPSLFDKLNIIAKSIRTNTNFFGGIQVILSGDFFQLPVVESEKFCFECDAWKEGIKEIYYFTEIIRQKDPKFQHCLNCIREGKTPNSIRQYLNNRIGAKIENNHGIKPTRIYSHNKDVDKINNKQLNKLDEDILEYDMEVYVCSKNNQKYVEEKIRKNCVASENLKLSVGAQVMLLYNLDIENGLVNGSRGVITKFTNDIPVVKFMNGDERLIDYFEWEYKTHEGELEGIITQIPLKLAYALTIHKCCDENTLIYCNDGIKRIKDIYLEQKSHNDRKILDISYGVMGRECINISTQIYNGGMQDTIRIKTKLGFILEGSTKHPLLTYNKGDETWKKMPELRKGDFLVLKNKLRCFGKDIENSYVMGAMLANGIFYGSSYCIKCILPKELLDITNLDYTIHFSEKHDKMFSEYYKNVNKQKIEIILHNTVYTNSISKNILSASEKCQIKFIQAIFDSNCIVHHNYISLIYLNNIILKDLQCLLLNHGIISKRVNETLYLSGYYAYLFITNIGSDVREDYEDLLNRLNKMKSCVSMIPHSKNIKKGIKESISPLLLNRNKVLKQCLSGFSNISHTEGKFICTTLENIQNDSSELCKLRDIYHNNIFYDKIVSITKSKGKLYDLYVPETHTFVGNGILNHNSQGSSLDCAVIDLKNIFEYGQGYVALSRVRNIEGLSIKDINWDKIKAHPSAIKFYEDNTKLNN